MLEMLLTLALAQSSQATTGELRIVVHDVSGAPLRASIELVSSTNRFDEMLETADDGALVARHLPFGAYVVRVTRDGFAPYSGAVEVRSPVPLPYVVTLNVAPVQAQVTVTPAEVLLDPRQTSTVHRIGASALQRRFTSVPGRALPDLVNTQAGWLLEANGVLHPRGSEYQTQYIVDGLPFGDNRSPAFAPELDVEDARAMSILTGGYPAEYGRKLGGIIEVVTGGEARRGFHGSAAASVGSFSSRTGDATAAYSWPRTAVSFAGGLTGTDRYLDPPVEDNFTNHGATSNATVRVEQQIGDVHRLSAALRYGDAGFFVPNELVQQQAGQRQQRDSHEIAGQFAYQRVLSASLVADAHAMVRDLSAGLTSNALSTPVAATQSRGFTDVYAKATVSDRAGVHDVKWGGDASSGTVNEQFGYLLTDRRAFDRDTPRQFAFSDLRADREQSLFVQDSMTAGAWTVNAGVRWDHYSLVVDDTAISPRFSVAWSWPTAALVARVSYDRAFQTPAVENLLLASSPALDPLNDNVLRLPVQPSRGNFYEASVAKSLAGAARLDVTYFERHMSHFADDDVLLETGVSFPIAFSRAVIRGTEVTFDLPHWRQLSASASYAWQHGEGELPITGGLFIGDQATSRLTSTDRFPITQDQRHTVRGRATWQATSVVWAAVAVAYGSGLPVEFDGTIADAIAQYGQRIVDRVNFDTGRVRPSLSLDTSVGVVIARSGPRRFAVQFDARNLTDRLNVINFAGLFSGTALGAPRSIAARLRVDW